MKNNKVGNDDMNENHLAIQKVEINGFFKKNNQNFNDHFICIEINGFLL